MTEFVEWDVKPLPSHSLTIRRCREAEISFVYFDGNESQNCVVTSSLYSYGCDADLLTPKAIPSMSMPGIYVYQVWSVWV